MMENNPFKFGVFRNLLFLTIPLLLFACKDHPKKEQEKPVKNILEKIAFANGFENWKNVEELRYTFNVDRDTSHFERSWIWRPKENKVTLLQKTDTVSYHRSEKLSPRETKADRAFINDKYWLLFPFNLVWDKGFSHEIDQDVLSPIDSIPMTEIVVSYNGENGYTPGDTYKIYVDDDFIVREWSYVPSGKNKPAMSTTWEAYVEKKGINISTMHKDGTGSFKIYFTGISIGQ